MKLPKQQIGKKGEKIASDYLQKQGHKIIHTNYRTPFGEIDIITTKNNELYFVEVKSRSSVRFGYPIEAVTKKKVDHIKKASLFYTGKQRYNGAVHFLAISVYKRDDKLTVNSITEIEEL